MTNCPKCGADLVKNGIGYSQEGEMTYEISLDEDGEIRYEFGEFFSNDAGTFYCKTCGEFIKLDEKKVKEILKKQEELNENES